jgi:pyridoxamine 5'-phosphate oxidase
MSADREERGLDEGDLAPGWLEQFRAWRSELEAEPPAEPDAMVLASADEQGRPSLRTVLLKGLDARGFEFFTNLDSRKGRELAANPHASLLFPWYHLRRQVIVTGTVVAVEEQRAEDYFASRAHRSRLGALASRQSSVIAGREVLERALAELERRYPPPGPVPRPERWSGFRVEPQAVEFWQGRRDRLHDRLRFRRDDGGAGGWLIERLSP